MATACSTCTFFVTFMPCSSQPAGGKRIGTYQSDWKVSDIYNNIHSKGHTSANYECSGSSNAPGEKGQGTGNALAVEIDLDTFNSSCKTNDIKKKDCTKK